MPIDPRTPSFHFIFISYNLNTNLFFEGGIIAPPTPPPEPLFFRPGEHLVNDLMLFFWPARFCSFKGWERKTGNEQCHHLFSVQSVLLACTTTNSHKKHTERGSVFNQMVSPGASTFVLFPAEVPQMNSCSRLIVCSPTGIVWTKPS